MSYRKTCPTCGGRHIAEFEQLRFAWCGTCGTLQWRDGRLAVPGSFEPFFTALEAVAWHLSRAQIEGGCVIGAAAAVKVMDAVHLIANRGTPGKESFATGLGLAMASDRAKDEMEKKGGPAHE